MSTTPSSSVDRLARVEQYLAVDPANPLLRLEASDLCLARGRAEDALEHAEQGLAVQPEDARLLNAKACALMSMGRAAQAQPHFADVLRRTASSHAAFNLAYCRLLLDDAAGAREALAPFMEGDAEAPVAALWVRCLHRLAEVDAAIAFAREHESRFAGNADFLAAAALAYFDGDAMADAERASRAALAVDEGCVEALVVRGSMSLGRLDADAAIADFGAAVKRKPRDGRSASGLGMARLLAGDATGAREYLRRAVDLMPTHIGTWHALGWACIALQAWDDADAAMRGALELDRNFGESHGAVAAVAALTGRREEAQVAIDRALRLDPQGLSARYAQMVLSGEAADPARLEAAVRRVVSTRAPGARMPANLQALRRH